MGDEVRIEAKQRHGQSAARQAVEFTRPGKDQKREKRTQQHDGEASPEQQPVGILCKVLSR